MARVTGDVWIDCHLCGFTLPIGESVLHYRTKKLVDRKCADERSQLDYWEKFRMPVETRRTSPQPVQDQGQQSYDDVPQGAGGGGGGEGGAGG